MTQASLFEWGSPVERERNRRIRLATWAYGYEFAACPIADDAMFDSEARRVRPEVTTGHPTLDNFFRECFSPDTGMWIHQHPELDRVARRYERLYNASFG